MNEVYRIDENKNIYDLDMSNLEKIIHSKKLNYKQLKQETDKFINNVQSENINIYIDVYDLFKKFYSPNLFDEFKIIDNKTKLMIVAEIVNIVGHYRHFFLKFYNKYTTFIFYYSDCKDKYLTSVYQSFRSDFYDKRLIFDKQSENYSIVSNVLQECFKIIKEILFSIPHAYLINSKEVDYHLVPFMFINNFIENEKIVNEDYSIIFSNEKIHLIDLLYTTDAVLFRNNTKKDSYFVDYNNIMNDFQSGYKQIYDFDFLPKDSLMFAIAISGYKEFSIPTINRIGIKKALKLLAKKLENDIDIKSYNNEKEFKKIFEEFSDNELELLKRNLKLINPELYPFNCKDIINIDNQIIDIINIEELKKTEFKYFSKSNLLLLEYLFEGEEIQ